MNTAMTIVFLLLCASAAIADESCPQGEVYSEELEMCVAERQS